MKIKKNKSKRRLTKDALFVIKIITGCAFFMLIVGTLVFFPREDYEQPALPINTNFQTLRNRNREVFDEYKMKHVLVKSNTAVTCAADNMQLLRGEVLPDNYKYDMTLMLKEAPEYYTLCLGDNSIQHTIEFTLEHGKCDILVSASGALPRRDYWDWKLNSRLSRRTLAIHTYAPEILRSNDKNLYVGFASSGTGGACKVSVKVSPFSEEELLPKLGLRGGQVMLKRDLVQ